MNVVTTLSQIEENIAELERGRSNSDEAYRALIKRGTCFVPYESIDGLSFAPSRFIGYVKNKLATHADNPDRDGRITNVALNKILGSQPQVNAILENQYLTFCMRIGVQSGKTGTFGVTRKYWITSDVIQILEDHAVAEITRDAGIKATEKLQLIKARIGQGQFREQLLAYWGKCSLTGCIVHEVLRASHIKPWRVCTNQERLDIFNGLLLTPNIDALFDKGLISFTNTGCILISPNLTDESLRALGGSKEMKIAMRPQHAKYLAYHRENRFQK